MQRLVDPDQGPEPGMLRRHAEGRGAEPLGTIDRAKGLVSANFGVNQEHPWFWTLIGVDQALHHLTGFGLSIFMAAN